MIYSLPMSCEINGIDYDIRSDYRAILDICVALSDVELNDTERFFIALQIFYPDFEKIPIEDYEEALKKCFWFISCGEENGDKQKKQQPRLVDWEQDFNRICPPINKIVGYDIRGVEYLHWWTFTGLYSEIDSECLFSQIVNIRSKKAKGKKLTKEEDTWYRANRDIVDIKQEYSEKETKTISEWLV